MRDTDNLLVKLRLEFFSLKYVKTRWHASRYPYCSLLEQEAHNALPITDVYRRCTYISLLLHMHCRLIVKKKKKFDLRERKYLLFVQRPFMIIHQAVSSVVSVVAC